jgi:hypothetical protein
VVREGSRHRAETDQRDARRSGCGAQRHPFMILPTYGFCISTSTLSKGMLDRYSIPIYLQPYVCILPFHGGGDEDASETPFCWRTFVIRHDLKHVESRAV